MSETSAATPGTSTGHEPGQNRAVIHEGLPTQLPDIDPEETQEWLDSFDDLTEAQLARVHRDVSLRSWKTY